MGYKYHLTDGYSVGTFPDSFEKTFKSMIHEMLSQKQNSGTILYVRDAATEERKEYNNQHPCVVATVSIDWSNLR